MKAMILAAGLGTRLGHHTLHRPKALVEVSGKPLLAHVVEKLVAAGVSEIVVNVHHFARQIVDYLAYHDFGVRIFTSDETDRLLDTGGGIVRARHLLDVNEPFLVHNVDILSDIDIKGLAEHHRTHNALATLAVGQRKSGRYFLFDRHMQLAGWHNTLSGEEIIAVKGNEPLHEYAFAGIHVISPAIFNLLPGTGAFSIVHSYLELCSKHTIAGFDTTANCVIDVGKPESLAKAEEFLKKQ
ncbi:MAG TPA: nucleotidyltransferase family protein [Tenuifilaceae bacterium]|nr:nucleotidyltransferase family protein [Tenuifilaceae bacterium]